jgi:hypothetical protein
MYSLTLTAELTGYLRASLPIYAGTELMVAQSHQPAAQGYAGDTVLVHIQSPVHIMQGDSPQASGREPICMTTFHTLTITSR